MALDLQDAVHAIARLVGTIPGLRGSPNEPPEKLSVFPFALTRPRSGEFQPRSRGYSVGLHTIVIEVHTAREDLPRDIAAVAPYGELVAGVLLAGANTGLPDASGNDTASAILALRYEFGFLDYMNVPTLGYRFELDIKIEGS